MTLKKTWEGDESDDEAPDWDTRPSSHGAMAVHQLALR